jgi:hypothetical protein
MFATFMKMGGAAGLLLAIAFLPAAATPDSGIGTQPEEYGSPPPAKKKAAKPAGKVTGTPGSPEKIQATQKAPVPPNLAPNNRTSTGREKTGPGAQPEEYNAAGGGKKVGPFDTVHNVRIRKDTPHPDSGTRIRRRGDSAR